MAKELPQPLRGVASPRGEVDPRQRIRELECALAEAEGRGTELERRIEERAQLYRLIRDISQLANRTESVADVIRGALRDLCERGGWTLAHFYYWDAPTATLLPSNVWEPGEAEAYKEFRASSWKAHFAVGESVVGRAFESVETCEATELAAELGPARAGHAESGLVRGLFVPVETGGTTFGVLELFSEDPTPAPRQVTKAMGLVAKEIANAIFRKQTESLSAQLEANEQQRIGRELHDGLGQLISGIGMLAQGLLQRLERADEREAAAELVQRIEDAKVELRGLVRGLTPVYSGAEGLDDALDRLVDETQTASGVRCSFASNVPEGVEDHFAARHLYYIAQEAVLNAVRHGQPSRIDVRLEKEEAEGRLVLSIRDDGVGLSADCEREGSGLRIMRHRAALMAARLVVESAPGEGTRVICRVRLGTAFRSPSDPRPPA